MLTLRAHESCLLVIDMQTGLLPAIARQDELLHRACRLARAARRLEVPVIGTEHWSEKIGATHAAMQDLLDQVVRKTHFDATREPRFDTHLPVGRHKVLLLGTEAHVCVLQTGLGLARMGYSPILVTDCVGSRDDADKSVALKRWEHHGLEAVSSEMALFEWLESPDHPAFREVLAWIKNDPPGGDTTVSAHYDKR